MEEAEKVVAVGKDSADSVVEKVGKAAVALAEVAGVVVRVKTHSQRYPHRRRDLELIRGGFSWGWRGWWRNHVPMYTCMSLDSGNSHPLHLMLL